MTNTSKTKAKKIRRRPWTTAEYKALRTHSRERTAVATAAKAMKRTPLALRLQAHLLGLPLGHTERRAG